MKKFIRYDRLKNTRYASLYQNVFPAVFTPLFLSPLTYYTSGQQ